MMGIRNVINMSYNNKIKSGSVTFFLCRGHIEETPKITDNDDLEKQVQNHFNNIFFSKV